MSGFRKAERKKAKIRLAISGATGSGKTWSGLLIAYGLVGSWEKVGIADSENGSADLYSHLGDFNVWPIEPPFTIDKFTAAIKGAEAAGLEVLVIDTLSHEWQAVLNGVDALTKASKSNNAFTSGWRDMSPKHDEFIQTMLHCKIHIIGCMRSKMDYEIVEENGRKSPKKIGLAPIQREGLEYEFTTHLDLSDNHTAVSLKDRTGLFTGRLPFLPTAETGKEIADWCESGADPKDEVAEAIQKLANCDTVEELTLLKDTLPAYVLADKTFQTAGKARFNEVKPKTQPA